MEGEEVKVWVDMRRCGSEVEGSGESIVSYITILTNLSVPL